MQSVESEFSVLSSYILNQQLDEYKQHLSELNLQFKDRENADQLISYLLEYASKLKRDDFIKNTMIELETIDTPYQDMNVNARIYFLPGLSNYTLRYIADVMDSGFLDVITEFIENSSNDEYISEIIANLYTIFPTQYNEELLRTLLSTASEFNNVPVYQSLFDKLTEISEYVEKPEWVNNESYDVIPHESEIIIPNIEVGEITNDELVSNIIDMYRVQGFKLYLDPNNKKGSIREIISKTISSMPKDDLKNLMESVLLRRETILLSNNRELFRALGPDNPPLQPDSDILRNNGYRMFSNNTYIVDENEEAPDDWFLGYCQRCARRISNRYYSVRLPIASGGWYGCFCSFPCMRQFYLERDDYEYSNESNPLLIIDSQTKELEKKLYEIGIQDRMVN